jgi:trehalose 6-phosphate phosphatase
MTALSREAEAVPSPDTIDLSRIALLLDVDGTLLDLAATPDEVVVPSMLREIIADLIDRARGAVALVSGRRIATLDRLFSPLVAPAIGGHGAEMRLAAGEPMLETSAAVLADTLRRELRLLADTDPRVLIEDKAHSIALHYRLAPEMETFLKVAVGEIVAAKPNDDVEFLLGNHVIDIKPKQFSKGSAVRELMTRPPFAGRKPIFIGDDTTDESVFAILPGLRGCGYSVGRTMGGTQGTFASPQDVRSWLRHIWSRTGA